MCLLIVRTFLWRLFFHLNWKVGWTKWFSVFFFWFYFAANLLIFIAVLLCNHSISGLLRSLALIVKIFQHLKNFLITFHWCLWRGVQWFVVDDLTRCLCMLSYSLVFCAVSKYLFLSKLKVTSKKSFSIKFVVISKLESILLKMFMIFFRFLSVCWVIDITKDKPIVSVQTYLILFQGALQ